MASPVKSIRTCASQKAFSLGLAACEGYRLDFQTIVQYLYLFYVPVNICMKYLELMGERAAAAACIHRGVFVQRKHVSSAASGPAVAYELA